LRKNGKRNEEKESFYIRMIEREDRRKKDD